MCIKEICKRTIAAIDDDIVEMIKELDKVSDTAFKTKLISINNANKIIYDLKQIMSEV